MKPAHRAVVLTALVEERDAVTAHVDVVADVTHPFGTIYTHGTFSGGSAQWDVYIAEIGEGNDVAAIETERACAFWSPDVVLFVGVAGGVKDVKLIDVVASERVHGYESGKETAKRLQARPKSFEPSPRLVQAARNVRAKRRWQARIKWPGKSRTAPRAFVKPIAAGEKVVASTRSTTFKLLREHYSDAVAVEMEGRGVLRAALSAGTAAIVIRGISDLIDKKAAADKKGSQLRASAAAAGFAFELLSTVELRPSGAFVPGGGAWESVTFDDQVDLRPALLGESMGPRNVASCPALPQVTEIVDALAEYGAVAVVGPSGSGKSMVAWHAAYAAHLAGRPVFNLVAPLASALPPAAGLLVIDNVQSYPAPPVAVNMANKDRRLLLVSTEPVVGVRRTVRVEPKAAVAAIAQGLLAQRDVLDSLLPRLDSTIGEGAFQTPVERQIEHAQRFSESPWQFMFNLGSGHRRMKRHLEALDGSVGRTDVLFAIAARQIAMRDTGCELSWLRSTMRQFGIDDLNQALDDIKARIPLVESPGKISTPHPLIATQVLNSRFHGPQAVNRRAVFWALFDDEAVPVGGLAWLIFESRGEVADIPPGLMEQLVRRCLGTSSVGAAASLIARLLTTWGLNPARLLDEPMLQQWLTAPTEEDAAGLSSMVNELLNSAKREPRTFEIISRTSPLQVAGWASTMTPPGSWASASLLERMGAIGPKEWRAGVAGALDRERLTAAVRSANVANLHETAAIIVALEHFDEAFALTLASELEPVIVAAMQKDVVAALGATTDLFFRVLGFLPKFLRREREPTPAQRAIVHRMLERVGAQAFASQVSSARRRDWHNWFNFIELFTDAAPDVARAAASLVDLSTLVAAAGPLLDAAPDEVDYLLVALSWDREHEPGRTLARKLFAGRSSLSWRAACVAPPVAAEIVAKSGTLALPVEGGLPNWGASAGILAALGDLDHAAARNVLRQNVDRVADGLLLRQSDAGEDLSAFLKVAAAVDEAMLIMAVGKVDVSTAKNTWVERLNGSEEERASVLAILPLAMRAGDGIMALAIHLQQRVHEDAP